MIVKIGDTWINFNNVTSVTYICYRDQNGEVSSRECKVFFVGDTRDRYPFRFDGDKADQVAAAMERLSAQQPPEESK